MATKYKKPIKKVEGQQKVICQNKDCDKMGKRLSVDDFYKSRNAMVQHHPYCKDCVNKMINVNNLESVYSVLKVLDTPFIMDIWNDVCNSGTTNYMGDYLRAINFTYRKKYAGMGFDDSIFELSENEEISDNVQAAFDDTPVWSDDWQGKYTKSDLKYLNDYYNGLQNDFKIITTNHRDYARKIAQASLSQMKAYQHLLQGEEGADLAYEKATKIFDMLSKSAQFAESQRGANDVALGCFGRVFDAVEKHNWVPEYIPTDEDMYDKLLNQFSNIERSL